MAKDKKQIDYTGGKIPMYKNSGSPAMQHTMQLLGLPYQFLPTVDQRIPTLSKNIGRKYAENIIVNAPVLTIIPGKPKYLPGSKDKVSTTNAFMDAVGGSFSSLKQLKKEYSDDDLKLYDFQPAFSDYFQYVNILCRTCAGFEEFGKQSGYKINGKDVDFLSFDWKNYRWNGKNYSTMSGGLVKSAAKEASTSLTKFIKGLATSLDETVKDIKKKISGKEDNSGKSKAEKKKDKKITKITKGSPGKKIDLTDNDAGLDPDLLDSLETTLQRKSYIQFFVDPDTAAMSKTVGNATQPSMFKQALDSASSSSRDIAFLLNSGGMDTNGIQQLGDKLLGTLDGVASGIVGGVNEDAGALVNRLFSSGKAIIRGENIMMPDIWSGADMGQSHTVTCHYKAPYGNRICRYMELIVPMMFWLALAYPRATTANSYSSPFLVKAYMPGQWVVNLGCVTSLEFRIDPQESGINTDGMATELEVTATITDLYPDMAMTPANNPILFMNNNSLVDFLGTTCGLNLIQANLKTKAKTLWNNSVANIKDTPKNMLNFGLEKLDSIIAPRLGMK